MAGLILPTRLNIAWTTIDGVRFLVDGDDGETTVGLVVIWIGVDIENMHSKLFSNEGDEDEAKKALKAEELMRAPDIRDHDNEPCLVIKNGNATGVTIDRTTETESPVSVEDTGKSSMDWTIYYYDSNFSAPGDSGSTDVEGFNGGTDKTQSSDVAYITPICWLWPGVKAEFLNANPYPYTVV